MSWAVEGFREFGNEYKKLWERELLNSEENSGHSRRGSTSGAGGARVPAAPFLSVLGNTWGSCDLLWVSWAVEGFREFRNEYKKLWERELLNLEENSDHSRRGSTSGADARGGPAAPFLCVLGST